LADTFCHISLEFFFLLCSIFEKIFRLPTKTRAGFIVADIMVQDEITQMQEE